MSTLDLSGANTTLPDGAFFSGQGYLTGSTDNVTNSGGSGGLDATLTEGGGLAGNTYSGVISDGAHKTSITHTGGFVTLTGANSFTGLFDIQSGEVILGTGGTLAGTTVALRLDSTSTLDLGGFSSTVGSLTLNGGTIQDGTLTAASYTLSSGTEATTAVFAGGGAASTGGTGGTVTLNGTNTYSGGTTVKAGDTIVVGNSSAFGTGAVTLNPFSDLRAGATGLTIANNIVLNPPLSPPAITSADGIDTNGNSLILSGIISGAGALFKTGTGTLTLSNANTYSGGTEADLGTLVLGNALALGNTGAPLRLTGGTLDLGGFSVTVGSLLINSGGGIIQHGTLTAGSFTLTTGSEAATAVFAGSGAVAVAPDPKFGTVGTVTLNGTNTYSGGTTISGGEKVVVGNSAALGTGALAMQNGTTLQAGAASLTVANSVSLTGTDTIDDGGETFALSGPIVGTGSLVKTGSGTLKLSGTGSYTGGTNLNVGTLALGNGGALGSGALAMATGTTLQAAAATLSVANNIALTGADTVDTQTDALTLSGTLSGTGSLTKIGTGTLTLSGTGSSYSGGTNLNAGTLALGHAGALGSGALAMATGTTLQAGAANLSFTNNIALTGADTVDTNGNALTLSGTLSGTGSLTKIGSGTLTLSGTGSYSGGTTVDAGTLDLSHLTTGAEHIVIGSLAGGGATVIVNQPGDTITGGAGNDTIAGTQAGLNGDSIANLHVGDVLHFTDASLSTFSYTDVSGVLDYAGHSLTLAGNPAGHFIASADASGGVDLTLSGAANSPPVLAGVPASLSATPGTAVTLAPSAAVSDSDDLSLASATVSVSGSSGDILATSTTGTSISASYNSATETLTLTGSDTLAHYKSVLDQITFAGTASGTRNVTWVLNDGGASNNLSTPRVETVSIAPPPAPPPPPPVAPPPANQALFGATTHDVTSPGGDIYALYETILGRAPDAIGLENWTAQLEAGASLNSIAQDLLGSAEYTAKYGAYTQSSDSGFVTQLYENGLHRAPDPSGLAGWDNALQPNENRPAIAVDIALSQEALGDLAPAFQTGVFVPNQGDSEVARLYYAILDRAPDAAGLSAWASDLAGGDSLANIATNFINSAEYTAKFGTPNNAQFVNALYEGALGRAPDPAGDQSWINALNQGASRGTIATDIAQSPEAMTHLASQIETGFKLA